ncbi:MAG: hypothetical protein AAF578_00220 [Pseudomonadota bacterium]
MKILEHKKGEGIDHFCALVAEGYKREEIATVSYTVTGRMYLEKCSEQSHVYGDREYAPIASEQDCTDLDIARDALKRIVAGGSRIWMATVARQALDAMTGDDSE